MGVCWADVRCWSLAWVSALAGWKSLAMWFTLHHNQITLPGIPPAKPTIQHPVWADGDEEEEEGVEKSVGGRPLRNLLVEILKMTRKKRCGERRVQFWTERGRAQFFIKHRSQWLSTFTPSSLCNYWRNTRTLSFIHTHTLSNVNTCTHTHYTWSFLSWGHLN